MTIKQLSPNRLYNLDYLRGLAAFGIMVYHYIIWSYGEYTSEYFLGRVGIYGVSIFYVLSGLTLFYVYYDTLTFNKKDILGFFRKRFFRIFPLFWLATIAAILIDREWHDLTKLFLNFTGLFGLVKWEGYYVTGAWSIGNELVFYLFFPFIIFFAKRSKSALIIFSGILFCIYLIFAFKILDPGKNLDLQWRNYVNPLNQVFLFLGGFLIGFIFKKMNIKSGINLLILATGILIFIFAPVKGNTVNLITGFNRLIFTLSCFLICLGFYKLKIKLPDIIHKPLKLLGEASYSIYLIHPLIFAGTLNLFYSLTEVVIPTVIIIIITIVLTLFISYLIYEYFERYFINMGNRKNIADPKRAVW